MTAGIQDVAMAYFSSVVDSQVNPQPTGERATVSKACLDRL